MSVQTEAKSFNAQSADFRADSLQVWNMRSYQRLYEETKNWDVVRQAIVNDGLGLVTEKISSEKDEHGQYFFTDEDRVMLQLTPARHVYHEVVDPQTGEKLMVPTELLGVKKDVMKLLSPWRRGVDQKVMGAVRDVFLNNPDSKGPILWTSTKAEKDEGPDICACNGQYGWFYKGDVDRDEEGRRRLTVYNFKYPGSADVALEFIYRGAEQIKYATDTRPDTNADEVMTTVAIGNPQISWDSRSMWQNISGIQKEVTGEGKIFGLPVETVLALQDADLHQYLKAKVAERMGLSLVLQLQEGLSPDQIQSTVRAKFIQHTQESLKLYLEAKQRPAISAQGYTGSNGDGCGNWGSSGGKGSMAEAGVCGEIRCQECGWTPRNAQELAKVSRGEIVSCPKEIVNKKGEKEPCGWYPGKPRKLVI